MTITILQQNIKLISKHGWHILAGTGNDKYCCAPDDIYFKNPMTVEEALIIIKKV